jgi:predicted amidohydrolase YtcJ
LAVRFVSRKVRKEKGMRSLVGSFALVLAVACQFPSGPKADLVMRGGKFITMAGDRPVAEALAVTGERITAIGTTAEINRYIGPDTELIDLEGALAVPGFIDSHAHLMNLGFSLMRLDLVGTRSPTEITRRLQKAVDDAPEGSWILGRGWDQNDWRKKEFPTHEVLDRVVPDRPVYLTRIDGHAGWANAKAMEEAGIDPDTPDPEGGEIVRDAEGNPTGIFIDRAHDLMNESVPEPSEEARREAFRRAQEACLRAGVTSLHDAGVGAADIALYQDALARGELALRLYVMLDGADAELLSQHFAHKPEISPQLTIRSVKLVADGALGSRGAALLEDYADRPEWRGLMILSGEEIYSVAERALFAGYQVNVHAIGDGANREVLNAFEKAFEDHAEVDDPRFRIEHAQILDELDVPRFAQLGVIAAMQGVHATSDMPWVAGRIGEERAAEGAYVWQKLLLSGAKISNGTDAPVENVSPLECFYASITRQDKKGKPAEGWFPDQRMSREQALRSYTVDAAYASFEEQDKGSLEPGKLADITVLSRDILTIQPREILDTEVLYTVVGGEVVYQKPSEEGDSTN